MPDQLASIFLILFLTEYLSLFVLTGYAKRVRHFNRFVGGNTAAILFSSIIAAIALFYVLVSVGTLSGGLSASDFLAERRADALNLEGGLYSHPLFYYAVRISIPATLLLFYLAISGKYKRSTAISVFLVFSIMAAANLIDGGRSNVVVVIVICSVMIYYRFSIKLKYWIIFGLTFAALFILSSIIFRQYAAINLDSIIDGFRYLILYSFGSVESMNYVFDGSVATYWGDYDALVRKFFDEGTQLLLGAKSLFIPDYSPTFWDDKSTNVYSSYGVYWDYFGLGAIAFILLKSLVISRLYGVMGRSRFAEISYYFMAATLPLSLFHDYFLTVGILLLYALLIMAVSSIFDRPQWLWGKSLNV